MSSKVTSLDMPQTKVENESKIYDQATNATSIRLKTIN